MAYPGAYSRASGADRPITRVKGTRYHGTANQALTPQRIVLPASHLAGHRRAVYLPLHTRCHVNMSSGLLSLQVVPTTWRLHLASGQMGNVRLISSTWGARCAIVLARLV